MFASYLRHKQHAVCGQSADENGSSYYGVDQVGPGLQVGGHRDGYGRGEGDQGDGCYDGGRLIDRRMADVAGQSSQISAVKKETTLKRKP